MGIIRTGHGKEKIIAFCEKTIEFFIYILLFALPFSKAVIEISATFIILSWVLTKVLQRRLPAATYLNIPIIIYIAAVFLSVLFSTNFPLSWKNFWAKTMEYILLFFIIAETASQRKKLERIIIVMLVSALMIGIDCIFQYVIGADLLRARHLEAGRITGSFQMPGELAGFLGPVSCLLLGFSFLKLKKGSILLLRSELILLTGLLIATLVRGAWLGIAAGICFLGVRENRKIAYSACLLLLITGIITTYFVDTPINIWERLKSMVILSDASSLDRKTIWQAAILMIKDRPLWGHGLSTFMGNFPKYGSGYYYLQYGIIPYAHNCYLQMAAETGIAGLTGFLILMAVFLCRSIVSLAGIKDKFYHAVLAGTTAGVLSTLVHSAVDTNLYSLQLSVLFWIMLGLNAAVQKNP